MTRQDAVAEQGAEEGVECLSRMPECQLAEDAPDVRGWEVTSPTSAHIGVVKDLLIDLVSMRVRYLDVALDADPAARRVLIPIGKVWIIDALDQVVIDVPSCLDALPAYDPGSLDRDHEHRVLAGFGERGGGDGDFYACPAFDDARFRASGERGTTCGRRDTDGRSTACAPDASSALPVTANGVELKVV